MDDETPPRWRRHELQQRLVELQRERHDLVVALLANGEERERVEQELADLGGF